MCVPSGTTFFFTQFRVLDKTRVKKETGGKIIGTEKLSYRIHSEIKLLFYQRGQARQ